MTKVWILALELNYPHIVGHVEEIISVGDSIETVEKILLPEAIEGRWHEDKNFDCYFACEYLVNDPDQGSFQYRRYDRYGKEIIERST